MEVTESNPIKAKVIGAGELGRRVVDILAERKLADIECIYLDPDRLDDKNETMYSRQVYLLEGVDLLVLVVEPEEISKHIMILSEYASRINLLVLGMTVTSSSGYPMKESVHRSLIRHGVDSVLTYYSNEYLDGICSNDGAKEGHITEYTMADAIEATVSVINRPAVINLDIDDVRNIFKGKGVALTGTGYGKGASKSIDAVRMACDPLKSPFDMKDASAFLVYIIGDVTLIDASDAAQYIRDNSIAGSNIIFGIAYDGDMFDACRIVVIASDFKAFNVYE